MDTYFLKVLFVVLFCFLHTKVSILGFNSPSESSPVKCIEAEKEALLKFKHGLTEHSGMLSTWGDDYANNADCCIWKGIECDNQTGHVQMLHLRGSVTHWLSGDINFTSLLELQNMEYLDLSYNPFVNNQIPEHLGSFKNLRYLNLSCSGFNGRIPYQLGNLSHLRYLDLRENSFSGAIPFQVGNLPILHTLRLGYEYHNISIHDVKWLSSLSLLKILVLKSVSNLGSFLHTLQSESEIIELRLINCGISDDKISSLFGSHSNLSKSLSILDLSLNKLTSSAFQLLSNHSLNLQELRLLYNNIVLSSLHYPYFPSLEILDLSDNNLTSLIFQGNLNFSIKLRQLHLRNCDLTDKNFLVPSDSMKRNSPSLVTTIDLNSNPLKSPAIFHWISNFTTNLEFLRIDYNNLQGEIPAYLGNICTLHALYLRHNNMSGEISAFIQNASRCKKQVFEILALSNNQFSGMLPNLSNLTSLRGLYLSSNRLTGDVPESHLTNLSKLEVLDLSDNLLSTKFGTTWLPPVQLIRLGLASCKMGPTFPSWLQTQSRLEFLDISDAEIDDIVPEWFWNKLESISPINMSFNSLRGTIPSLPIKCADWRNSFIFSKS